MRRITGTRVLFVAFVGGLLAITAPELAAQTGQATVYGKVTSESGSAIEGATASINELSMSARTNADGNFTMKIPVSAEQGKYMNLRVRAIGYAPQVRSAYIGIGPQENNFKLKADGSRADEAPVRAAEGTERAKVPFAVVRPALEQSQPSPVPGQADPFGRFMFPPELVMQYQDAISLQESQRATLQGAIQEAQAQVIKMQWALALEAEKLTKLLDTTTLDEKEVLSQIDRILAAEREIKRAQMTLMIRIKNTLTPAQQTKLRQLRG